MSGNPKLGIVPLERVRGVAFSGDVAESYSLLSPLSPESKLDVPRDSSSIRLSNNPPLSASFLDVSHLSVYCISTPFTNDRSPSGYSVMDFTVISRCSSLSFEIASRELPLTTTLHGKETMMAINKREMFPQVLILLIV